MPWSDTIKSLFGATDPFRYLKSAFWMTASRAASMAVSLLATFYVARALGPQNFGELSYAQSVVGILALFSAAAAVFYRDIVRHPERENIILGTAWTVYFASAFITSALALVYTLFLSHDHLTFLVIAILCLAQFFSPFTIIQQVFYAKTETKWLSITNFLIHLAVSLTKIAVMVMGHGVLVLAMVMLAEQILTAVTYAILYTYLHRGSVWSWRFNSSYVRQLILDSLPIVIIAASGTISARIDQIFIKHYIDTATVGLYSVAVQLSEVWQFLPGLLLTAVFPAIINARSFRNVYRRRLAFLGGILLIYGVAISLFLTLLAPIIITAIYGSAFSGAITLLQIYSWSISGMILGFLVSNFLIAENLRKIQIMTGLLPMILNIVLNMILIPKLGAPGAAVATVVSYSLAPAVPFLFSEVRSIARSSMSESNS